MFCMLLKNMEERFFVFRTSATPAHDVLLSPLVGSDTRSCVRIVPLLIKVKSVFNA